jgi:hypothetical protein
MSVSDASAIAVAVLTAAGVILALLTFRRSLDSPPKLKLSVGQEIILHYTSESRLILTADFAFINKGALPGLVTEVSADLYGPGPKKVLITSLRWRTFEDSTSYRDGTDGRTRWWTRSGGPVHTLIVPGRAGGSSGATSKIRLYQDRPVTGSEVLLAEAAVYPVTFSVREGSSREKVDEYKCELSVSDVHAKKFSAMCTEDAEDGTWEHRLILRRRPSPDAAAGIEPPAVDVFESAQFREDY